MLALPDHLAAVAVIAHHVRLAGRAAAARSAAQTAAIVLIIGGILVVGPLLAGASGSADRADARVDRADARRDRARARLDRLRLRSARRVLTILAILLIALLLIR